MTIYFCDGAGWNGEISRFCIVVDDMVYIETLGANHTNNEMEYRAVLYAINEAANGDTIYTDSKLVVEQLHENWKCNYERLQNYINKITKIWEMKPNIRIKWIRRNKNLAGKELEK